MSETETLLQSLEREGHNDPLSEEVYQILHALDIRSKSTPDVSPIPPSPNSPKGATCENCGLPSDAVAADGYAFTLETRPDNKFQHRSTKHRVWCCSKECGIQSLARNKYGEASHKWPVTLAEFRQLEREPFFMGLQRNRDETESTAPVKPARRSLEYKQAQMARRTVGTGENRPVAY